MDSLTHLVAGALTPLAFRGTPRRAAVVAFGIAAGELPDMDVFFGFSTESLLTLHRGVTHALFSQPVLVLLVVLPFYLWLHCRPPVLLSLPMAEQAMGLSLPAAKKALLRVEAPLSRNPGDFGADFFPFGRMYLVALVAVITHIYLDCMTTFGTRSLLPFSDVRIGFPSMFIVDPLLTLPLLALLAVALRQPSEPAFPFPVETGIMPSPGRFAALYCARTRRLAQAGLAWIFLYPLISLGVNATATALLEPSLTAPSPFADEFPDAADNSPRFTPSRLRLLTEPFSPFLWKAIIDEGPIYRMGTISLLNPDKKRMCQVFAKPEPAFYESLKRQLPLFSWFEEFSPLMVQVTRPASALVRAEYAGEVLECAFVDLRYLASPDSPVHWVGHSDPNFVLEVRVGGGGGLLAYRLLQRGADRDTPWIAVE